MNVDLMPELHWAGDYPLAIMAMLATSITLLIVFKCRHWL